MITKRVIVIIKNVITLIHYGLKHLSMRALEIIEGPSRIRMRLREYQKHLKSTIDYLDNPRYISADYDEQDIMELYTSSDTSHLNTSRARDTFDRDTSNKWDKKTAPYCETP